MTWRVILTAILLAGYAAAYLYGRHDGEELERGRQLAQDKLVRDVQDAAQRGAATEIAKIEIKNTTIKQEVQREILEKPVYRECRHDARGLSLINAALTGTEPAGDSQLPEADATH